MNTKERLTETENFVRDNLANMCKELIGWYETGILVDGKVRIAANMLDFLSPYELRVVEDTVKRMALELVAKNGE